MESSNNGICGHSSDLYWKEKVIFSVDTPYLTVIEEQLESLGAWYKKLQGCWQGEIATSYVVLADDFFSDEFPVSYLDDQVCVLQLTEPEKKYNGRPTAILVYNDKHIGSQVDEVIGKFTHVSQREALDNGDYTFDPSNSNYFIVKE